MAFSTIKKWFYISCADICLLGTWSAAAGLAAAGHTVAGLAAGLTVAAGHTSCFQTGGLTASGFIASWWTAGQAAACDAAAGEAAELAAAGLVTCSFTASWLAAGLVDAADSVNLATAAGLAAVGNTAWSPAGGSAAGGPAAARLTAGRAAEVGHLDSGVECGVLFTGQFSRIPGLPFSWVFLCISSPRFGPITIFLILFIIFHFQSLFIKEEAVP